MTPDIDPTHPTSVLEVLKIAKVAPDEAWADVRESRTSAGLPAVAANIRFIYDDGLIVSHRSPVGDGESLEAALARVALSLRDSGLRSVDIGEGQTDDDEEYHTNESLRQMRAMTAPALPPILH